MKKITFIILVVLLYFSSDTFSQKIPSKKAILKVAELANNYFMDKWSDPGAEIPIPAKNKIYPSNIWTRAVYYEGLMSLYKIDKKKVYYDYAVEWGNKHDWNLRGGTATRNGDNQACGQTYIDLYLLDKKEERIKNIKVSIDSMMTANKIDDWTWVDALQMAMPVFAKLGSVYKDTSYFNRMYNMYAYTKYKQGENGLYNPADGLWWRDKDFVPPYKEPNGKNCYWSRGNGWVVAALVRVLDVLPKSDNHYQEYLDDYKKIMDAIVPLQRNDGSWNVSLLDSTDFGGKELTGTALFTYGMAWGINNGFLNRKKFLPVTVIALYAL
jgi:unsaturated rhamnogalacturonyl hydrolase